MTGRSIALRFCATSARSAREAADAVGVAGFDGRDFCAAHQGWRRQAYARGVGNRAIASGDFRRW
jgi:hypothetical protein